MAVLVTGGLGFIGAAFVASLLQDGAEHEVVVLDAGKYAADPARLQPHPRLRLCHCDLLSWPRVLAEMHKRDVREVVHFAASTHVTASFADPMQAARDNFEATHCLLECCRLADVRRLVLMSTDEVYGDGDDAACEEAPLRPSNPYSASKAAADLMAQAYMKSFGLQVVIARSNNVIGPGQHPEKLVPATARRLAAGAPALVEGDGLQTRCFLAVADVVAAVHALRQAPAGVYNVASPHERTVLEVVDAIRHLVCPERHLNDCLVFGPDRPSQDRRYAVDGTKLHQLGWAPRVSFLDALRAAVTDATPPPPCAGAATPRGAPSPPE